MQQGDKPGRHVRERAPNPRYALSSETPSNTHNLGASGGVASQPPPYPGTQTLPSMGLTFSQRPTQHPEVGTNFSYQASSLQGQGSYNSSNLINQNYNLHLGNMNRPISPNARPVQPGIHSLSPGAVSMPRKSLAGMISPIRQQAPPPLPLNMPPPSSPVVVGGRMQSPMSPLSVYMSQSQSPQRRTTVSHMSNVSARCYPPQQSPTYCQNPVSYNYSPQTHQVAMQRSPVPNPMYVDPSQHGQMSPMIPRSPHHSPQPVQGPKSTQSPYKAARQLNMSASPQKSHYMLSGTGDANPSRWQYGSQSGQKAMWENVNVTQLAPLPVLSSDTLDLLSTLTVSTVSSPIRMSSSVTVAESQMPKSTLLQQQLLMPATPIRTTTTTDRLLAIVGQSHTGKKEQDSDHSNAPPSRSDSKPTARPPQSISEKVTAKPVAQICCTAATRTASIMTSTKADNPPEENMTATHSKDSFIAGELHVQGTTSTDNNMSHEIVTEQGRLDDESDAVLVPAEIIEKRIQLCEIYRTKLQQQYDLYKEYLTELFFLRNGGNFMNYVQFKKRPSTKLVDYLKSKLPDIRTARKVSHKTSNESVNSLPEPKSPASDVSSSTSSKRPPEKHSRSRSMSHDDVIEPKQRKKSIEHDKRPHPSDTAEHRELRKLVQSKVMSPVARARNVDDGKTQTPLKLKRLPKQSTAAQLDESIGSQEEILERAKQEAVIQRKVVELRKQGLWTQRRLPKVLEPARSKTHWDYLLEEMRWLAGDFAQERKWKRAAARKLVRAVAAFHKEQHDQERRAKREEQNRLRRIASTMAREIRVFWGNVGKVVEYKQRSLLDEKRQKALDMHLSYIVDQTEKYSDWLTKGLNKPTGSLGSASPSHSMSGLKSGSDDDFLPQGQSTDDEETIAVAEEEFENEQENEVSLLKKESELPFEELLSSLPEDLIENIGKPLEETVSAVATSPVKTVGEAVSAEDSSDEADAKPSSISLRRSARKRKVDVSEEQEERKKIKVEQKDDDTEFDVKDESAMATDDESTIAKEEEDEKIDHGRELADLQAEGDMPIEELMKMYGAAFNPNQEGDDDGDADKLEPDRTVSSDGEEPSSESEDEESGDDSEKEDIGMDYLFKADTTKDDNGPMIVPVDKKEGEDGAEQNVDGSPTKEITDVAAEAASLQPTGFTLATTQVVTPIPVLLKHTLREYQHIGLDWLVTMYDKRLNGILADEMGLGKTIQTIALLAHLACEKGVWGPHLIVVPTSVMLNWEMEFKKWCPGFKILTYYGSQKERKAKRTGWTKSNAFHVCITSYKLVLQDNASFRRKKWKYLVLDEAQNIKNFKSQRWQTLLNFNSQRRLLLTGTPLQNNLMELWSLMHFLMPHVFQSHKEFKEWFSKPLTGMIEGGQEYNEKLVRRLHKVLRPFLLRRIKKDVEKQMPNKYEHVVRCHLSKRQRFLYDDFMSQASTKDTLETGHFMSVINILMQLRKVCNHPNLFEPRPIVSPFYTDQMSYHAPSLVTKAFDKNPFESFNPQDYHMHLPTLANIRQTNADLLRRIRTPRKLIEELDDCGTVGLARGEQPKAIGIREQLANLLKEREKSGRTVQHGAQPVASMPLLTIPITSGTGPLQLASTSATALVSSRVITLPQSKSEDSVTGKSTSSQAFTLQYQTPQGTRVAIPNKQIRQLAGGIVKIMTPTVSAKTPAPNAQSTASSPSQGAVQVKKGGKAASVTEGTVPQKKSKGKASPIAPEGKESHELLEVRDPGSYVDRLEREFRQEHRDRCMRMADENERRCHVQPVWLASDTISFLKNIFRPCDQVNPSVKNLIRSSVTSELVKSEECRIKEFKPVTDRFAFVIPLVEAKPVDFYVSHPNPSSKAETDHGNQCLQAALKVSTGRFHSIDLSTRIQFPEARLIQYDCGKLQVLDVLLRRFYTEKHKCLIFTQMTKVLDILEAFLSYHGYRYLRLDGSTRVEQRMLLMERFNNDPRIFCFILSTRSGGIGVNLTGADTVIFYDSDWNPTMDAQAQDRCHRIGQTRDVHIYRLISERTVEENILKKANQKRLLGDIAIEGGSFTTAFFKEHAIKDLFNEPTGLEDMPTATEKKDDQSQPVLSKPVTARQKAIAAAKESKQEKENNVVTPKKEPSWADALQQTEDKEDVDAAKQLQEEQDADMEEFTENAEEDRVEGSRVHEEMKSIYEELSPIEKYALRYLEETTEEINREELELAEEQVHRSKQDWELAHLVALKEEEERRLEEEEDEIFYTREDAENQIYVDDVTKEKMPIWFPPTPPQDDDDVYIDPIMALLYVPGPMPDDLLPVVQVKNQRKRAKAEAENSGLPSQRKKPSRTELVVPKSLFNRQPPRRRESKPLKSRREQSAFSQIKIPSRGPLVPAAGVAATDKDGAVTQGAEQSTTLAGTGVESVISGVGSSKNPDWLAIEDWKLLQAVQDILEMPLSLCVMMPAHTPNWELVADIVNTVSSVYRSPKMCKQRFENEIAPREEGRSASDVTSVKKKGTKTPTKPKVLKAHKSSGVHAPDHAQYCALYAKRFEVIKNISRKRTGPVKSSGSGQFQRNPKHISILTENGISFDKPLNPEQVAELRANRIQREKEAAKQQQLAQSQSGHASGQQITSSQVSKPGISTIGQLTAIPLSGSSTANIIVNTSAFKKIGPHSVSKTTISNSALQQTLLRSASTGEQPQLHQSQIQIQGQGTNMVSVGLLQRLTNPTSTALVTSVTGSSNAITLSSLARPASSGAVMQAQGSQHLTKQLNKQQRVHQQILHLQKQGKKITKNTGTPQKLQITSEAMKKLRQQHHHQQLEGNVVTVAKVPGKGRTKGFTTQDLEQLFKNQPIQRATAQKPRTAQVQIAPVHAQAQAQQVQEAAAQQAAQHIVTSKPLPLTVSVSGLVSAVNLSGISTTFSIAGTSGQSKSLVMTAPIQQQLQRQLMKQRIATQQGQAQQQTQAGQVLASKVGMKQTVYAMVAASPQIVTQNKRRVSVAASAAQGGSSQQAQATTQPVLTVTKLLHAQTMHGQQVQMKQVQGSETLVQQVRQQTGGAQQLQMGQATIIPSSIAQQRLITPQRQIRQLQQPAQMILTPTSGQHILQRQANQNIVASLSLSAAASTPGQQQVTLSSTASQSAALSQQLQSLLNPQVVRAQTQNTAAVRNVGQQHHLVLQQQPALTVTQQNAGSQIAVSGSSTALIPSLVLPVSAVARSQTQTNVSDGSSVQFVAKTTSQ